MQFLPYVLIVLFVVFLIAIVVVMKRLRNEVPTLPDASNRAAQSSQPGEAAQPRAEGLETMRLAVEQMDTDHIENLLDMGATLKPGAEEIFREELAKRKAAAAEAE